MAKKSKDTTASAGKTGARTGASGDPTTARNLIRLLNILALLLAITAFLLQFFAVLTHAWKYQTTHLQPLLAANDRSAQGVPEDSRLDQSYGLFSRGVKVYANNDEQLNTWASTRFPRVDNGDDDLHQCLSQTNSLRGSILACNNRLRNTEQCHCRRYPHWNAIIFFEITALVLLGLVVVIASLLTTQYHGLLKQVGAALAFLAFLFLLIGLILILSTLKRETRTIADAYPHDHARLVSQVNQRQRYPTVLHQAIRRQAHETYRAYSLSPGQHPYNDTHFQQYSEQDNAWVYLPYTSLRGTAYAPRQQSATQRTTTGRPLRSNYGPVLGYDQVYEHTRARIGWSTVLSILSLIPALLLPALLGYSWMTGKKLGPENKTVTTTTTSVKTEYVPVPQDVTVETVPLNRPTGVDAIRQGPYDTHGVRQGETGHRDDQATTIQTHRT